MLQGYQVKSWIEENYPELTDKVYPGFTTKVDDLSVVYFINTSVGGYVGQDMLELRVIDKDYDTAEGYKRKLMECFSTEKKNQAIVLPDISFTGGVSGGGFSFRDDIKMWELTTFYILKTKERI